MNKILYSTLLCIIIGKAQYCLALPSETITVVDLFTPRLTESTAFIPLDGTRFRGNYKKLGEKVTVVYEDQVLRGFKNYGQPPNEALVKRNLSKYKRSKRIILDIESWSLLTDQKLDKRAVDHASWYLLVLKWAHEVLPNTNIGYFGLPLSPWFALKNPTVYLADYQKALDLLIPVLNESDTLYPEFYIYYEDLTNLNKMMAAQIKMARVLNKPVFPFMWHRGPGKYFNEKILPGYLLSNQCDFVSKYADGIVWWSISYEKWDNGIWYKDAIGCFI
jgi:hypothetical protein